jgi:hypothetical protein
MSAVGCDCSGGVVSGERAHGGNLPLIAQDPSLTTHHRPRSPRGFWTAPVTPRPLAYFRIGLASVLLFQAISLIGHLDDLYGRHGIVAWSVISEKSPPAVPSVAWLDAALRFVGVPTAYAVPLAFAFYVSGLLGLLVEYRATLVAGIAWLSHTALMTTGAISAYGVDEFAQIGLFYCFCFTVGRALSLHWAGDQPKAGPSFGAWFGLRILQLHVCIIYTASGVEKAMGNQWWNGEAIWRAVMGFSLESAIDCSFLPAGPWLAKGLCWMTLLLEAGIALFVWHPRLRKLWLIGIVGMHLGIALVLGLWTFSATMIVFDVAAFGVPSMAGAVLTQSVPSPTLHWATACCKRWKGAPARCSATR